MADNNQSTLISQLDESERPREKAMLHGFRSLTDAEVMAIIFATGVKGKSVLDLCREILDDKGGHLSLVTGSTVADLCSRHKGIGKVKAITLLAALELGRRAEEDAVRLAAQEPVTSSEVAYRCMSHHFRGLQHEEFWVMYLNRAGRIVRESRISQGGTAATTVDVKIILREALECLASSMILFHNHPSGTLRTSIEDDRLTSKIVDAARMLDINVNDHLVVASGSYYSYADHGKL